MHLFCADFDQKQEEVILVCHYDLFLPNCGGLDLTADSYKIVGAPGRSWPMTSYIPQPC